MKKKIVLFLLVCGLVMGIGIVPNATATGIPIDTYWDVGQDWTGDTDGNSTTQIFDQIQYYSQTTTYQYDSNGIAGLNAGDTFVDWGNAYSTALLPTNPPIDTEGMGATYEFGFTWSDLTGTLVEYNPGSGTDTYTLAYDSGTIDFYLDFPDGSTTYWADHGADLGVGDDSNFDDGVLVATVEILYGTGHSNFNAGTTVFTGGDYNLTGKFTHLTDNFWYEGSTGDDLLEKYVNIGWLLSYTAGDTDPGNFEQTIGGTDPYGNAVLFKIDADHDSSLELQVIPEPATMLLLGSGLLGLAGFGRKKKFF